MDVKEAIENRRAYRSLDPFDISAELVHDLASVAQITHSCENKQPWNFIFIYNQDKLTEFYLVLSETNKWAENTSTIIAVFSKPELDYIIGEPLYYLFDIGMATALIILRVTELGLVAHPIAGFKKNLAKKILGIPEDVRLITLIIIGKHSKDINPLLSDAMKLEEKQRFPRKKLEDFVYINDYNQKISE